MEFARLRKLLTTNYGFKNGSVSSGNWEIFKDRNLIHLLEEFVATNSPLFLPLKKIIVNKYVVRESNFRDIQEEIADHLNNINIFQNRFYIEAGIRVYLSLFEVKGAEELCKWCIDKEIDFIDFIFTYPDFNRFDAHTFLANFKEFCFLPILKNPRIKLMNFPFCFLPGSCFRYRYKHIVSPLKGNIFLQRRQIMELKSKSYPYFKTCQDCRCKLPCYTYTDIMRFPEYESLLTPQRQSTAVFVGGSLLPHERKEDPDIVYLSPAEQGDMFMSILEGFKNILIIDGYFYTKFPPTTFEVLLALENNINVFGASSTGALRAVELDNYGMRGVGYVYSYLKQQRIKPYHIVAQTYNESDLPLSTPLVTIIYFLEQALKEGLISKEEFEDCLTVGDSIHFTQLSFDAFFKELRLREVLKESAILKLEEYLDKLGEEHFNIKKKDALFLINNFKSILQNQGGEYVLNTFNQAKEKDLKILSSKYSLSYDLTLPKEWRTCESTRGISPYTGRDHRERAPEETLRLVEKFFEDFDMVIADTTRYDAAPNFIISIFFIPFYFLERSVSSSTGNGDIFEEALLTAYMELLERIPLYAFPIKALKEEDIKGEVFPYQKLPQYYNWDVKEEIKLNTLKELGYIKATEILAGREIFIPRFAIVMSSDGNAAGNTFSEAILYGIYEVLERDISRIYDSISNEIKHKLVIDREDITDSRSQQLLKEFEKKGCKVVLYNFINIYQLPCVRCEVYDLSNRIKRHGGTAVRGDLTSAIFNALSEAYMGYIIDFMGVRDDFRSLFDFNRNLRLIFRQEYPSLSRIRNYLRISEKEDNFSTIKDELDFVIKKLTEVGIKNVIVANNDPLDKFKLRSVKVIVPGLELLTVSPYKPSLVYEGKVKQTLFTISCSGLTLSS